MHRTGKKTAEMLQHRGLRIELLHSDKTKLKYQSFIDCEITKKTRKKAILTPIDAVECGKQDDKE